MVQCHRLTPSCIDPRNRLKTRKPEFQLRTKYGPKSSSTSSNSFYAQFMPHSPADTYVLQKDPAGTAVGPCAMMLAVVLITTALSTSLPFAGAYRPLADGAGNRANLTQILTPDRPFQTFLRYLNQTNLVEVFQNQAYRTHQGITILVPADRAFAAVQPSVLSGLRKHQLKSLMMYHALPRYYALKDFDGLSRANPVTTFAGGLYTVNVTYDAGAIRLLSRWADAKVAGTVYGTVPMAVYEIDRVLLPEAIFRAQPPVQETPAEPAPAASAPDADAGDATKTPGSKAGGKSSACRAGGRSAGYAAAGALCAVLLVAL